MPRPVSDYAIYQDETFLDLGTVAELAEKFNVAPETIRFWSSPAHLKRSERSNGERGGYKIVIKLDDEE